MKVKTLDYQDLAPIWQDLVNQGYEWGCQCGESYRTREGAERCKKCQSGDTVYYTPQPRGES
jgi:hypothetical protein